MASVNKFSCDEMKVLNKAYKDNLLMDINNRKHLASQLGVSERKIRNFVYSRRAKDMRMKKPSHSSTFPRPSPTVHIRPSVTDYFNNHTLSECTDIDLIANSYDGIDDGELASTIENNLDLREHFNGRQPPLLSGTGYEVVGNIGSGCNGRVIMAKHVITKDMVIVKIPLQLDHNYLDNMLMEFANQEKAYHALKGHACSAPQPLGIMRMRSDNTPRGFIYLSVSEYLPVVANADCSLTLDKACQEHCEGRALLTGEEWMVLIQDLIEATHTLLNNDISHNDIKQDNIIIQFRSDNTPKFVLIDFGMATKLITSNSQPMFEVPKERSIYDNHNAPELFFEPSPLPTSDLYSIAKLTQLIGRDIQMAAVEKMAMEYCLVRPPFRKGHHDFYQDVIAAFNGWIPECNLPLISHLRNPNPLYH